MYLENFGKIMVPINKTDEFCNIWNLSNLGSSVGMINSYGLVPIGRNAVLALTEIYGNLEDDLRTLFEKCKEQGNQIYIHIGFHGDEEGWYVSTADKFIVYDGSKPIEHDNEPEDKSDANTITYEIRGLRKIKEPNSEHNDRYISITNGVPDQNLAKKIGLDIWNNLISLYIDDQESPDNLVILDGEGAPLWILKKGREGTLIWQDVWDTIGRVK